MIYTFICIYCNGCDVPFPAHESGPRVPAPLDLLVFKPRNVRRLAAAQGWKTDDQLDYCPACASRRAEKAVAA